ncbi:MAG TPA: STAS/SEC14 domain-containing protein [Pyrinomonadaceae bacterium]|nr:STAS/SEC14 domain-containing protein [Pyrinomonadaceae bacterium]
MLEILESPKHVVAMKLSGSLSASDIEQAYKATDEALKSNDRISFFAEIDPSTSLTFEGVAKDLKEGICQLGNLSKFYRAAVVTDKTWLSAIARVEGVVFSSIDVRVFDLNDRAKALAWAAEKPEPVSAPAEPEPSIHFLQTTSDKVFAYEVDGRLRERDIKAAVKELKPYFEREGKFNVLARMKNFSGFDLFALLDDDYIRLKVKSTSKVGKYALIGAKSWMRNLVELVGPITNTEIRTFDASEEEAAWEWIGASQALLPE